MINNMNTFHVNIDTYFGTIPVACKIIRLTSNNTAEVTLQYPYSNELRRIVCTPNKDTQTKTHMFCIEYGPHLTTNHIIDYACYLFASHVDEEGHLMPFVYK